MRTPVRVVGLTGGIGAGKSEALAAFAGAGAATLSSDGVVHDLYLRDDVRSAVADRFGPDVLAPDGSVDRSAVGARVFADPAERRWLEELLLPLLFEEFEAWRDAELAAGARLLVHEAPTLFEAGVEDRYDAIVLVTAPGMCARRDAPALPSGWRTSCPSRRRPRAATSCTENDGDLDELRAWVSSWSATLEAT